MNAALKTKVLSWCDGQVAFNIAHQWDDPYEYVFPTVGQLPDVAAHLDGQPMPHDVSKAVTALGNPTTGVASWARVLSDLAAYENAVKAQIAAAKAGDLTRYQAEREAVEKILATIREDLRVAGFGPQTSCAFLFTPPTPHPGAQ